MCAPLVESDSHLSVELAAQSWTDANHRPRQNGFRVVQNSKAATSLIYSSVHLDVVADFQFARIQISRGARLEPMSKIPTEPGPRGGLLARVYIKGWSAEGPCFGSMSWSWLHAH
jgi:hypothetical protein